MTRKTLKTKAPTAASHKLLTGTYVTKKFFLAGVASRSGRVATRLLHVLLLHTFIYWNNCKS